MAEGHEILGISAEHAQTAQVIASGGFGALVFMHLRHPGTLLRATGSAVTGIGTATLFTEPAMLLLPDWLPLREVQVAALLGLLGVPLAMTVLKAAERLDLGGLLGRGKDKA